MQNKEIIIKTNKEELNQIYNCVSDKIDKFTTWNVIFKTNQIPVDLLKIQSDLNKIINELP